ncbi:methyltransferase domain-containing protein [Streptomyces nogalater]
MVRLLDRLSRGGGFLEVGSGTGVVAVTAALGGCARVTALDISPEAVENTRRNAARHGVADRVRTLRSDLFSALDADDRYDTVFWNSSFIDPPEGHVQETDLHRAIFDPGYEAHRTYLTQARRHLRPGGRLLLGFSNLGNDERLRSLADEAGLTIRLLNTSGTSLVPGVEYRLLELLPR